MAVASLGTVIRGECRENVADCHCHSLSTLIVILYVDMRVVIVILRTCVGGGGGGLSIMLHSTPEPV